jgi:hypothetical protein
VLLRPLLTTNGIVKFLSCYNIYTVSDYICLEQFITKMLYTEKYFHLKLRVPMIIFSYLQVCGTNKTAEAELQL